MWSLISALARCLFFVLYFHAFGLLIGACKMCSFFTSTVPVLTPRLYSMDVFGNNNFQPSDDIFFHSF